MVTNCAIYITIKELIIQNIQKSWDGGYDINKLLKVLVEIDLNILKLIRDIFTKTDTEEKKVDQDGLDIKYREKLRIILIR